MGKQTARQRTVRPRGTASKAVASLAFENGPEIRGAGAVDSAEDVWQHLSACERVGPCLWLGSDETARLERLVTADGLSFADHRAYRLGDVFPLPDGPDAEVDVEGMSYDDGYLWVVGSHCLKRKKPRDAADTRDRLATVEREANRCFLGRLPLVPDAAWPGLLEPVEDGGSGRRAACLKMTSSGNALTKALAGDAHLGPFLAIPAKDNGFDVEGLAARGDRLFLGLRGPVLRGWAVVLELRVKSGKPGRLTLRRMAPEKTRYRKHFLDLGGLGIRDLAFDGYDMVILAGPTMDLHGPMAVYRWPQALLAAEGQVITADRLVHVADLPYGRDHGHAEGMTIVTDHEVSPGLLVVYDSPGRARVREGTAGHTVVDADIVPLTSPTRRRKAAR